MNVCTCSINVKIADHNLKNDRTCHTNFESKLKTLITYQTTTSQNVGGIFLLRSMFDNDLTVNTEY